MGKRWYVAILAILTMVFSYHPAPAHAQHLDCTFSYTWTNTVGTPEGISFFQTPQQQNTPFNPLTRPDNQYVAPDYSVPVGAWRIISQNFSSDELCTPTQVSAVWYRGTGNTGGIGIDTSMDGINWTNQITTPLGFGAGGQYTYTWNNPSAISFYHIRVTLLHYLPRLYSFSMTSPPPEETTLIKPLTNSHELSMTMPQDEPYYANYVLGVSTTAGLPVHAPADGAIMKIEPLTIDVCDSLGLYECYAGDYALDLSTAYSVSVRTNEGDELIYVVANAPRYIKNEVNITGGCVLGETIRTNNNNRGASIATDGNDNLLDRFTLAPADNAEPCWDGEEQLNCEGGESRLNLVYAGAQKSAGVTFDNTTITIPSGGRMYALLALPSNQRVYAEIVASGDAMIAQFGTRVETATLTNDLSTITFGWTFINPDQGDFSTVSLQNTGATPLKITDICVAYESNNDPDDPDNPNPPPLPPPPSECYFFNNSFQFGASGWDINSTSYNAVPGGGSLSIANDGKIAQHVSLYLGDAPITMYTLTMEVGLWYNQPYDPEDYLSSEPEIVQFFYDFLAETESIGTVTIPQFYDAIVENRRVTLSVQIPLAFATENNFIISVDMDNMTLAQGLRGVTIYNVCLSPDDGIWHGHDPGGDGGNDWVAENCESPSSMQVTGDILGTVAALANFARNTLQEFVGCYLMRAVNGLYAQTRNGVSAGKFAGDWVGNELVPYASGYMSNLFTIGGGGTTFNASSLTQLIGTLGSMPSDIFSLGLWVLANFFGFLIQIIQNLSLIFEAMVEFFTTILNIGNEIIGVWNSTAAMAMPGIDDCSIAPETKVRCIIFWIMENTILGQPYGFLIIPLITSGLTIIALRSLLSEVWALVKRILAFI
jgi:hypothetical protein